MKGIVLLLTLLLAQSLSADPIRKGLKAVRHHDYKTAYAHLQKSFLKDSSNKRIHYAMAVYWADPENLSTDNKTAFEHIHRAWELRGQSNPVFKYKAKTKRIRKLAYRLDSLHFNQAMKRESEPETRFYLANAVNPALIAKAREKLVDFAWVESKATGQYQYLEAFRKEFPNSVYDSLAFGYGALWRYKECEVGQSIECLKELIEKYPNHPLAKQAELILHQYAFAKAEKQNSAASFDEFLKEYPNSIQAEKAKNKRLRLQIDEITPKDDYRAFIAFAQQNPGHPNVNEALNIAFDLYTDYQNDSRKLLDFIQEFPSSPFITQAKEAFFNLYTDQGTNYTKIKSFLREYPNMDIGDVGRHALFFLETDHLQSLEKIQKYIERNPSGEFVQEAHLGLYNLVTDYQKDYKKLQSFPNDFPNSPYVAQSKRDYYLYFTDKETNLERAKLFIKRHQNHPFLGQAKSLVAKLSAEACLPVDSIFLLIRSPLYRGEHFLIYLQNVKESCNYPVDQWNILINEAEKAYPMMIQDFTPYRMLFTVSSKP